jgi:hypothetical protein
VRCRLHRRLVDDWGVGRVTKSQAEVLLQGASRGDAAIPNPSPTNLRAVSWDWIDVEPDDQTLRIEFLHGIVDGLHHIEIDEDDRDIRVTVFLGLDPDLRSGAYVLVGLTGWTKAKTGRPVGRRRIIDGAER